MTPTIEARGLEKRYRRTQALDGLDLVATPSARSRSGRTPISCLATQAATS
jgi:hypothetical protein